jgi:hypothetical protein
MSYLQKYVRQLKPRNESYTPPVEKIQTFLIEGKDFSTAMESVLGVAYAAASKGGDEGKDYLKLEATEGTYASDFQTTKSVHKFDYDKLMKFGENIKKEIKRGDGTFAFQESGSITSFWRKYGGTNNTSKTDIILGGKNCSVKNAAGAQLMSGKKGESIATTVAASEASGLTVEAEMKIVKAMNELEKDVTEGYFASLDNIKRLKEFGGGATLKDYATAEFTKYNADLAAWKKEYEAGTKLKKDKPTKPTDELKRAYLDKPITKGKHKGKKPSEFPTEIGDINAAFLKKAEGLYKENADAVKTALEESFNENNDFKLAFVYEAASGTKKFGKAVVQSADYLLSWQKVGTIQNFKINVYPIKSRKDKIIKTYADQINLIVNWKTSSTTHHEGYNVWQNVRLTLQKLMDDQETVANESYNIIKKYEQQLNEGYLSEGAFWDKVKEVSKNLWDKATQLWDRFTTWFASLIEKIKAAAAAGIKALSNIMGLELDTNDTLRNNKSLKLR